MMQVKHNIPALNHGKEYEPIAKEKYISLMKCNHKEFTFSESGLFVDPSRPYLGASTDLLVHCSCCGMGLSEMKSPFSIVNEIPSAKKISPTLWNMTMSQCLEKSMHIMLKYKGN